MGLEGARPTGSCRDAERVVPLVGISPQADSNAMTCAQTMESGLTWETDARNTSIYFSTISGYFTLLGLSFLTCKIKNLDENKLVIAISNM